MDIYGIPLEFEITTGTLGDAEVIIMQMKVVTVVHGQKLETQDATLVFSKEDAVSLAAIIVDAATAEKEVIEDGE